MGSTWVQQNVLLVPTICYQQLCSDDTFILTMCHYLYTIQHAWYYELHYKAAGLLYIVNSIDGGKAV